MQKTSGTAACASCKHQRKKCTEKCVLAPYFPAEKSREFKAVHKVFGVSNITKIVKNLKEDHDRRKAVESLIWEAFCRQKDPVFGPYGEYKRIYEELKLYKSQYEQILQMPISQGSNNNGMAYETTAQGLINGWNINKRNENNLLYINENSTVESWSSYNNKNNPLHHHVQNIEKLRTENNNGSIVIVPQPQAYNEFNQQYFLAGQYNPIDFKSRESMLWEDHS
ncbi:LOB domain-containing protein 2 [Nicotiana tomentosiformis]|uniref:LOB domain-containing protein 2 n=1 Tax=Nicotiana tomentosiformis TaxID=4098 RepID=UPI00051AB471|nr:LOB domain-containing protein 2 [Nicotiana tomentosiformis]